MMRIRPILKRFTRKKKKKEDEIQVANDRKKLTIKSRLLNKVKRLKTGKKAKHAVEDNEENEPNAVVTGVTDEHEAGFVTVHVNADTNEQPDTEKLEPRESVVNALRTKSIDDEKEKDGILLRVPEGPINKNILRRSLDQLISDRTSGISKESPFWSRKQFGARSASNISIYSKQQQEHVETRTVWTQTEIPNDSKTDTVEKKVGPSPWGSLDAKLEDIGVGPSPFGSVDFGIDSGISFEPVENPKLAKIKTRILKRFNYPNLDNCEAGICVDLLRFPKPPFLVALNRKLSQDNALFNVEFLELNGLNYLLALMEYIAEEGLRNLVDILMMLLVSECATSVVNSKAGREHLILHGEHIVSMARGKTIVFDITVVRKFGVPFRLILLQLNYHL